MRECCLLLWRVLACGQGARGQLGPEAKDSRVGGQEELRTHELGEPPCVTCVSRMGMNPRSWRFSVLIA